MSRSVFIAGQEGAEIGGIIKGLQNHGYLVSDAQDGNVALHLLLKSKSLSAIILSSALKRVSTPDLCRQIKKMKRLSKTPILVLADGEVDKTEYSSLGIAEIIQRPFYAADLHDMISAVVGSKSAGLSGNPKIKQQLIGVAVLIAIFTIFFLYHIIYPMFIYKE